MYVCAGKLVKHLVSMRTGAGGEQPSTAQKVLEVIYLLEEKRVNLRSCNCKWRWGLSEELSASLAGVTQAGKPLHFNTRVCVTASHTHTPTHKRARLQRHPFAFTRTYKLHYLNC